MLPWRASVALLAFALAACEQEDQQLPFTIEPDQPVEKTVTASQGGTIAAVTSGGSGGQTGGVSVAIPANSVQSQTQVTVTPQTTQQAATTQQAVTQAGSGTLVQGTVFKLAPEGTQLSKPAQIDLKVPNASAMSVQEKLGLGAVLVVDGKSTVLSTPSIDLTSGIAKTEISTLGTVAMKVSKVEQIQAGAPALNGGDPFADAAEVENGAAGYNSQGHRDRVRYGLSCSGDACEQALVVYGGQELLDRFKNVGGTDMAIDVMLNFNMTRNQVDGYISARALIKVLTGGSVSSKLYGVSQRIDSGTVYRTVSSNLTIGATTYQFEMVTVDGKRKLRLKLSETEVTYKDSNGNDAKAKVGVVIDLDQIQ